MTPLPFREGSACSSTHISMETGRNSFFPPREVKEHSMPCPHPNAAILSSLLHIGRSKGLDSFSLLPPPSAPTCVRGILTGNHRFHLAFHGHSPPKRWEATCSPHWQARGGVKPDPETPPGEMENSTATRKSCPSLTGDSIENLPHTFLESSWALG